MSASNLSVSARGSFKGRQLLLEPLEDRRVLAAATPWHNDVMPFDVNTSGFVSASDAAGVIGRLLEFGPGPLAPPDPGPPLLYVDTNGDNVLSPFDAAVVINRLLNPTHVSIATAVPFSIDTTPGVTVKVTSPAAVPDGTTVKVDVDLNNDGDYSDAGELARSTGSLFQGGADFDLFPALPLNGPSGPYTVRLRARVTDGDGLEGVSSSIPLIVDTEMSSALEDYVHAADPSYQFSLARTVVGTGYAYYVLDMTSQTWRSAADVNKPVWRHWVELIVPAGTITGTSLLIVSGGSNNFGSPPSNPDPNAVLLATTSKSVIVNLRVVPNEPVIFTDETRTRTEDEIIAYSFDKYMQNIGDPGNETWPLLVAMAKSAVRTMDTVQTFVPTVTGNQQISDFIVTGYSKRGWTTWLTAASDDRVRAIIPGVFDNLNQGPQMVHHYSVLGKFSEQVQDYSDMQIFERIMTPEGQQLSKIVDPYRYLRNGRFDDMPKLILNGAGDEFFVSDSSQFYIHDLPGDDNYMRYFPNAGHGLDGTAVISTLTFMNAVLNNLPLPKYSWTIQPDNDIELHSITTPLAVKLWQATNPTARDFRHGYHPEILWTATNLFSNTGTYVASAPMPAQGATAYFIEMTYDSGIQGMPYIFTTEIRVKSTLPLTPWPYESGFPDEVSLWGFAPVALPAASTNDDPAGSELDSIAMALSLVQADDGAAPTPVVLLPVDRVETPAQAIAVAAATIVFASDLSDLIGDADEDETESLLVEV